MNEDSTVSPDCCNTRKPPERWEELPRIAVENIYSFLSREQQRNMSMVCRNWNTVFCSPSLWRKFEFHIPEHYVDLDVYPEVQLARKYGDMFHHVEIIFPLIWFTDCRHHIWKQIKLFFEALTSHSRLETIKCLRMNKQYLYDDIKMSEDVYQTIKNFFLTQHQLKTVEFRNAYFKESETAELLRLIFHKNSKSLQNICLIDEEEEEDFDDDFADDELEDDDFIYRRHDFNDGEITENVGNEAILDSFLNIKTLQLNYSRFFEHIMITFYEYSQNSNLRRTEGNLEFIGIACDGSQRSRYRGIPPECWKLITKICPPLRIDLTLQIKARIGNSINLFVVPNMPLKRLIFKWDWCESGEEEIGVLLRRLQSCGTDEYLEDLSIRWPTNVNNLAIDLKNFLPAFKKLRNLDISYDKPTEHLYKAFSSWIENKPTSIQTLFITHKNIRATWKN